MRLLRLDDDRECYPVLVTDQTGTEHQVPEDLARRFTDAEQAFWATQVELRAYLAAVRRDDTAYQRHAEIVRRRLLRGRRRPFRRPHP